jgi:hypothetical protein
MPTAPVDAVRALDSSQTAALAVQSVIHLHPVVSLLILANRPAESRAFALMPGRVLRCHPSLPGGGAAAQAAQPMRGAQIDNGSSYNHQYDPGQTSGEYGTWLTA